MDDTNQNVINCDHVILVESLFHCEEDNTVCGPCIKCKQIVDGDDASVYDDGCPSMSELAGM